MAGHDAEIRRGRGEWRGGPANRAVMNRRLTAVVVFAAVAAVPTGALWVAGEFRHRRDVGLCTFGRADSASTTFGTAPPPPPRGYRPAWATPAERYVDRSCIARREARRWGPFLVLGDMPRDRDD